ncbi:glycosyltransferase family 2 protein [Caldinitratiruptor microaerophilus]|uniref:glycosyltransferase family 2 protein n=1 Tax=Caldinitratiruptor microaerophilus TaxID=671077 RepID=UPI0038736818
MIERGLRRRLEITAIIVNFNSGSRLEQCVMSLRRYLNMSSGDRIIVIDNASTDGSETVVAGLPCVDLVKLPKNIGYGAACNHGAALARSPLLLFLNPDVRLISPVEAIRGDFASDPQVVCVAPMIVERGQAIRSIRPFPTIWSDLAHELSFRRRPEYVSIDTGPMEFSGYAQGSCLFIRTSSFEKVGGFDPAFFLYYEETDLLRRMASGRFLFDPRCRVEHESGGSSSHLSWKRTALRYHGKVHYFKKHSSYGAFTIHRLLTLGVLMLKLLGAIVSPTLRVKRDAYRYALELYLHGHRPWNL